MISDGFNSTLQGYIDGVMDGNIIVSKAVRAAVERHVKDLSKASTSEFPFHFDAKLAAKVCRFYPTMLRHSIGRHAGMPFDLSAFQVFCESSIFGWLRDADETRRFRRAYRSMARKGGKSTWIAGESIYMGGFDRNPIKGTIEPVAQVVLAATKREQVSKVIFAEAKRMTDRSPLVAKKSRFVRQELRFDANDGEIITTGSDKPFDGLNPHCVQLDELHAWREHHREFFDTMMTGSGSRDQPLISIITTAGDDNSHLWLEVYNYAKAVATGAVEDDSFFSFIAELDEDDDPFDESLWVKANPNLGTSISIDYLRQQATEAKTSAVATNRFVRYHCNRIVSCNETAFDMDEWDECLGQLSDWNDADNVGAGCDLGARDDLAAAALVARFPIGERDGNPVYRYELRVKAYISEETHRDLTKQPFYEWINRDLLIKSRYPIAELTETLVEQCQNWWVKSVAYDPYNAQQLAEELQRAGLTPLRMAQNHSMFNEPIRDFLQAIRERRVVHDGNPMLRWAVKNAVLYRDRKDMWMFDKKTSSEKIDPIVAVVMAFRVCSLAPARPTGSYYL